MPKIRSLYKCLDNGMAMDQIVKIFDMSKATLTYWRRNRTSIEEKLIKLETLLTTEEKIERKCPTNVPIFGNIQQPVCRQRRTNPAQAILPIQEMAAETA